MKKLVVAAGVLVVLGVLAALAKRLGPGMQSIDWEQRLQAMPENAPPKWIYRNVTAIRENTDRILERLEHQSVSEPGSASDIDPGKGAT